jgi:hypothetical protein
MPWDRSQLVQVLRAEGPLVGTLLLALALEAGLSALEPWPIQIIFNNVIQGRPPAAMLVSAGGSLWRTAEPHLLTIMIALLMRTIIVVPYHMPIIGNSDLIIVVRQGRIVESGTHSNLLDRMRQFCDAAKQKHLQPALSGERPPEFLEPINYSMKGDVPMGSVHLSEEMLLSGIK